MLMCAKCDHNISSHREQWDVFGGVWRSPCRAETLGRSGREVCRCSDFQEESK